MPTVHGSGEADGLEDRIYEAAVLPEFWPALLASLAERTTCRDAIIFSIKGADVRLVTSSPEYENAATEFFRLYPNNERTGYLATVRRAGFISDYEAFGFDRREQIPVFRDWMIPRGYGDGAATAIPMPTGEMVVVHVERAYRRLPFEADTIAWLDAQRPHLARATLLSARLAFERARTAVETLSGLGLAACAVTASGAVLVANAEFATAGAHWTTRAGDRIALNDRRAEQQLGEALAAIQTDRGVRSLPLVAGDETSPGVLHVVPIRRAAHDLFGHAAAILVLTRASTQPTGATPLLQALFDLSAVEADVAARIAAGQTVEQIAVSSSKSVNTVRNQLKSVLDKTACARQADLARLLAQLVPAGH
ncbi:MAG: helix-turn-helix transcriptional regulator [Rhizobiaceae bacterium]